MNGDGMELFNSQLEILKYIETKLPKGKDYTYSQVAEITFPVFMSEIVATDINFLLVANKMVDFRTGRDMVRSIANQICLSDESLTLTQFHVLCGLRGPADSENFDLEVLRRLDDPIIQAYAKHKEFPGHLKNAFFNHTQDVEFLPAAAQDIFVF
jgi:hypothetical protein